MRSGEGCYGDLFECRAFWETNFATRLEYRDVARFAMEGASMKFAVSTSKVSNDDVTSGSAPRSNGPQSSLASRLLPLVPAAPTGSAPLTAAFPAALHCSLSVGYRFSLAAVGSRVVDLSEHVYTDVNLFAHPMHVNLFCR